MKLLIIAGILALVLAGCAGEIPEAPVNTTPASPVSTPESLVTTPVTTPEPAPYNENNPNLKPLELLGYYIDEAGDVWVDSNDWEICEPDIFRRYMFGTWEGQMWMNQNEHGRIKDYLVIDDSENSQPFSLRYAYKFYRHSDTIIFLCSNYQVGVNIFWLDIKEPDIMYSEETYIEVGGRFVFHSFSISHGGNIDPESNYRINSITKINAEISEPQNGYMSRLRLYEIMWEHGIDFDMLFEIEYLDFSDEYPSLFVMDGYYNTFPIYLISEEDDKFVFKSEIWHYWYSSVDVVYTIEKINGEWVRTVELNQEQLKALHVKPTEPDLPGLKAYELLEYFIDENDWMWFSFPQSNEYCPEAFIDYFLGAWNGDEFGEDILIIDATEKSSVGHDLAGRTVWVSDHVVAIPFPNNGVGAIYWLNINEPDKMYFTSGFGVGNGVDNNQIASFGQTQEGWFSNPWPSYNRIAT